MRTPLLFIAIVCLSAGCNSFEFSPEQTFDRDSPKNLNAAGLRKMQKNVPKDDTIRVVITGDTQRSYNEVTSLVKKINTLEDLDFVAIAGDLSEFGVLQEMEWLAKELEKMTVPYVAVIGNHDLVNKGASVFKKMYGEFNYSFVYRGIKFICHNTNGREYGFAGTVPDIGWLTKEVQPEAGLTGYVGISHVPPNSEDYDPALITPYHSLFDKTPGFLGSFHAHTHTYSEFGYHSSAVPYVITATAGAREFLLVKIINNKLSYERIYF
jgi:Icc protein